QVKGFDNYTVVVISDSGAEHLMYKHAIAHMISSKPLASVRAQNPRDSREGRGRGAGRGPNPQRRDNASQQERRDAPATGAAPAAGGPAPAPKSAPAGGDKS